MAEGWRVEWEECKWRQNTNCISRPRVLIFFSTFYITTFYPPSPKFLLTYYNILQKKKSFTLNPSPFVPWGKLNYLIYRIAAPPSSRTKFLFSRFVPFNPHLFSLHRYNFFFFVTFIATSLDRRLQGCSFLIVGSSHHRISSHPKLFEMSFVFQCSLFFYTSCFRLPANTVSSIYFYQPQKPLYKIRYLLFLNHF